MVIGWAMGSLGRSKERGWGVVLRPGLDVFALRVLWEERLLRNGLNRRVSRLLGE